MIGRSIDFYCKAMSYLDRISTRSSVRSKGKAIETFTFESTQCIDTSASTAEILEFEIFRT